ncbi:pseudouridine synthase [Pirellulaceae bacterium SH467]
MSSIVNIAAYKYVELDELDNRRLHLKQVTAEWRLKGTILLSHEGINLFLAGERVAIDAFLSFLRASHPGLADLPVKESLTDYQPFHRMLVKLKREIIPVGDGGKLAVQVDERVVEVEPIQDASPKLPPQELKRWLDEGKPIALLDTRNTYETDLGTFEGAIDLRLRTFREFPQAAASLPDEVKKNPVVMFCTGGIRCEKIGPYMKGLGFENIYQLEGGILKYFEECQQSHYRGDCFVFDQRVAVDPNLSPSDSYECFACKHVLTPEEIQSDRYREGQFCPHCYQAEEERKDARQARIRQIASEQRGCIPYENRRWISIPQRYAGLPLLDALCQFMPGYSQEAWIEDIKEGLVQCPRRNYQPASAQEIVQEGARFLHCQPGTVEPPISDSIDLIDEDEALVVVSKGAPLPVHPSGRYAKNTLLSILQEAYAPEKLRPCHRLDLNTTGLVVFARRYKYAQSIQQQFADGAVEKVYLVQVDGNVEWDCTECREPISKESLPNGGRGIDPAGQHAESIFRVLERGENSTKLEAKLITGRTHQLRLHLASLGHPVVNDPLYLPGGMTRSQPDAVRMAQPMQLHCYRMALRHPVTNQCVEWVAPREPSAIFSP